MRVQLYNPDEDNATLNQVPSIPSERRSKRKMERGKYMGRGLFKSPPQPHMCIQDSLIGSKEPCFINVLSWEKISMPANRNDPIPLYGGIRILNNSMNALSCSNLWQGGKPGEQPVIFAVLANTEILKLSGKTAKDPNEREALIYLILDFIEVNAGVQFQHHFKVLSDRDVVGELKDIWFIIQSKRDQERLEITYHGDSDRGHTTPVKIYKKDFSDDGDKMRGKEVMPLCSDQEKEKLSRSHSYPNGRTNSNKGPGTSWYPPPRNSTKQHPNKDTSQSTVHNLIEKIPDSDISKELTLSFSEMTLTLPSFSESYQKEVVKSYLLQGSNVTGGEDIKKAKGDNCLYDQLHLQDVATEILPSLESLDNSVWADSVLDARRLASMETKKITPENTGTSISHPTFVVNKNMGTTSVDHQNGTSATTNYTSVENDIGLHLSELVESPDTRSGAIVNGNAKFENDHQNKEECDLESKTHGLLNSMKMKCDSLGQITSSTDALQLSKTYISIPHQNTCEALFHQSNATEMTKQPRPNFTNLENVPSSEIFKPSVQDKTLNTEVDEKLVSETRSTEKKGPTKIVEAAANITTSEGMISVPSRVPCTDSLQALVGKQTVPEGSKVLEVMVSLHDQENNKLTIG